MKIVHALYLRSAGDQKRVFDLLGLGSSIFYFPPMIVLDLSSGNDSNLATIYDVTLQDHISRGKLPNFARLRQLSDPQIEDYLALTAQRFRWTFPSRSSLTLNKIFDDLSSLERQYQRLEQRRSVCQAKVVSR